MNRLMYDFFNYDLLHTIRGKNEEINIGQVYSYHGKLANLDIDFYTIRENMPTERFIENDYELNREVLV